MIQISMTDDGTLQVGETAIDNNCQSILPFVNGGSKYGPRKLTRAARTTAYVVEAKDGTNCLCNNLRRKLVTKGTVAKRK
jgi:hypothetical protein